jgi:hypothetical protein
MTAGPVSSYRLLLPPGWVRVPALPALARREVRRLVRARFSGLPPDTLAQLRHEIERTLLSTVRDAADNGASDLLLLVDDVAGMPVSASCVVYPVLANDDTPELPLRDIAQVFGSDGDAVELVPLAGGQAVRVRRDVPGSTGEAEAPPAVVLTYVVPVPDTRDQLVLAFSTSALPLADALCGLFDSMAATLQWR